MRKDLPPYYKVSRGRAFFQLGRKRAARAGMSPSIPLGPDASKAKAEAWKLYHEWLILSGRKEPDTEEKQYPPGSEPPKEAPPAPQ